MEWSWMAWMVSVTAVIVSGAVAWLEGNWSRRAGLDMGFANHGGMWGDLLLLPIANAAVVPHLSAGQWIAWATLLSGGASAVVHCHWYGGSRDDRAREHMWPTRRHGSWHRDLSAAGWLHVLYVTGELTFLVGFLIHEMPDLAVLMVAMVFTIHVPIGLLQPRWYLTRRLASVRQQPLLVPCLAALWIVAAVKV